MIKVDKASAGSGKTFTLAHTYIDLLKDDLSYRHILAVTFTNKATAEMKERILDGYSWSFSAKFEGDENISSGGSNVSPNGKGLDKIRNLLYEAAKRVAKEVES